MSYYVYIFKKEKMIETTREGFNFCTCMMCNTSFFFDKEDIKRDENVSKKFPFVECPHCGHEMKLGWNNDYFEYKKKR